MHHNCQATLEYLTLLQSCGAPSLLSDLALERFLYLRSFKVGNYRGSGMENRRMGMATKRAKRDSLKAIERSAFYDVVDLEFIDIVDVEKSDDSYVKWIKVAIKNKGDNVILEININGVVFAGDPDFEFCRFEHPLDSSFWVYDRPHTLGLSPKRVSKIMPGERVEYLHTNLAA